ncbi:MAG TPA: hypothetical protein VFO19_23655 [Vicinamibacterales bacterium]|nr:hypothetical protein [Vicinamibacterales bacterium]
MTRQRDTREDRAPKHGKQPAPPQRPTSQGGYGHKSSRTGRTTPQGAGRNQPNRQRG